MQILFTFCKTYKYNHCKNVSGNLLKCTTEDIAAYGHILVISESLIVSMSSSFVDWVIENNFMVERRMIILSTLILSD